MDNQNKTEETQIDYETANKNNQPITLGELRKEKIGRPVLVLEMLVLFIIVLIALPIVNNMLNDENSTLYKLVKGNTVSSSKKSPTSTKEAFLDGKKSNVINSTNIVKFNNIVFKDCVLSSDQLKCNMYSYNDLINLDEHEYYMVIMSNDDKEIGYFKLTGTFDYQEKTVIFKNNTTKYNTSYTYKFKFVEMKESDYPEVTLTTDESGIGSIVCKNDEQTIEYTFENNNLIGIDDEVKVKFDAAIKDEYLNRKELFEKKANLLGIYASVSEEDNGFKYEADLDLTTYMVPDTVNDYNYYKKNTKANVIKYALIGKGYDCK